MNCEGAEDLGSMFVSHIKNEESVDSLMRRIDRVLDGSFSAARLSNLPKSHQSDLALINRSLTVMLNTENFKHKDALLNHFRR